MVLKGKAHPEGYIKPTCKHPIKHRLYKAIGERCPCIPKPFDMQLISTMQLYLGTHTRPVKKKRK